MLTGHHHKFAVNLLRVFLRFLVSTPSSPSLPALPAVPARDVQLSRLITLDPRPPPSYIPTLIRLTNREPLDPQAVDSVEATRERIAERIDVLETVILIVEL